MSLFVEPRERVDCFCSSQRGQPTKKAPANREGLSVTSIFAIQIGCAPAVSKTPPFLPLSSWAVVWVGRVSLQTSVEPPCDAARAAGSFVPCNWRVSAANFASKRAAADAQRPSPFGRVCRWLVQTCTVFIPVSASVPGLKVSSAKGYLRGQNPPRDRNHLGRFPF